MEDRCVVCGEIVPEGRQICATCEKNARTTVTLKKCPICGGCPTSELFTSNPPQYGYRHCSIATGYCKSELEAESEWNNQVENYQKIKALFDSASADNLIKDIFTDIKNQNIKADAGKPQLHLVPTEIINCIARVREFGNKKYKDSNSWKRVEKERYIDAMFRHLLKYVNDNNSVDKESGLPHLWHIACNVAFLCEMEKEKQRKED